MIAIIDYDAGNIRSVEKALLALGQDVIVTADRDEILHADKVILPGVGAMAHAMQALRDKKMDRVTADYIDSGRPFLGICLGMQMLFDSTEEGDGTVKGLGVLPGRVILVSALRQPFAVSRGSTVQLVFDGGSLVLRAAGTPLQDAVVGDLVKVRNKDSGVIVSGTVMADGTVHVVAK